MRRVGDKLALGVEQRAGKIQPLLDVDRIGGRLQPQAHLLRYRHVQVVEHLQHHRIDRGADGDARRARLDAFEHQMIECSDLGLPAGLDHGGGVGFGDDRRPFDFVARMQDFAQEYRRALRLAAGVHVHCCRALWSDTTRRGGGSGFGGRIRHADGFDRDRFREQGAFGHEEGIALAVRSLELLDHVRDRAETDNQRGISAVVSEVHPLHHAYALRRHALVQDFLPRRQRQLIQGVFEQLPVVLREFHLHRLLAHCGDVGEPHAVGREHAGERMDEHPGHAQRIGHQAGVLAARAAEAAQRVFGHVVAALHRNLLDRVGHVAHGDVDITLGHLLRRARIARGFPDFARQFGELVPHHCGVQRLVPARPEHRRKKLRLDLAQHDVAVGDRQRPVFAIRSRSGIGRGRIRAGTVARAVEMQDRAAAGRDRVDAHHRRAHAHTCDLGFEGALEFAGVVRYVGRSPAHVEADDLVEACEQRCTHGTDDAARRPGKYGVLALEAARVGKAAVGLHEHQPHAFQFGGDLLDVAPQYRRKVGVDHGGVAAADQLHHRAHLVRHRHLAVADGARHRRHLFLVLLVAIAVHADDGDRAIACVIGRLQIAPRGFERERGQHFSMRADALFDFDDLAVEQFGQDDVARKNLRPVLVGDPERVAKTAGDGEHRALALALQQRIGGDRGAHFHRFDLLARDRRAGGDAEQMADAGERGVAVVFRIVRQQLVRDDAAVGAARDHVGESAAAIDPELPAFLCH